MLSLESAQYEIENLPDALSKRLGSLGLTVRVIESPKLPNCLYLEASSSEFDVGVDLDEDMLPAEISGWVLPEFCLAVEVFTSEKDPVHAQMQFGC